LQPVVFYDRIGQTASTKSMPPRSYCPINLGLEVFGDTWTLLVLRDLMFGGKRHFRELLQSDEGISSNILADRLKRLIDRGILTKRDDPTHKQKAIYSLTERGIALLPVLLEIGAWSRTHLPETRNSDPQVLALNRSLVENPGAMRRKMVELRKAHLAD
jgi:DNA-binding HxlR family transcriptional regulator